jgi:hypothetical protein
MQSSMHQALESFSNKSFEGDALVNSPSPLRQHIVVEYPKLGEGNINVNQYIPSVRGASTTRKFWKIVLSNRGPAIHEELR